MVDKTFGNKVWDRLLLKKMLAEKSVGILLYLSTTTNGNYPKIKILK